MRAALEVLSGPTSGGRTDLPAGRSTRVGRSEEADLALPHDPALSRVHFELEWDGRVCRLRDVSGRTGTLLNGKRVYNAVVADGDRITAGNSAFAVRIQTAGAVTFPAAAVLPDAPPGAPVPAAGASPSAAGEPRDLLGFLRGEAQPLFALVDAARDREVVQVLRASQGGEYESLYDGDKGRELDEFAPYLVRLPAESALLAVLLAKGWGKSWGVFLTCAQALAEVRRHFRHFLIVQLHDGREVYFRFYDPRVLRPFLPTCTPEQIKEFFGPVRAFYAEGRDERSMVRFTPGGAGVQMEVYPVARAR